VVNELIPSVDAQKQNKTNCKPAISMW